MQNVLLTCCSNYVLYHYQLAIYSWFLRYLLPNKVLKWMESQKRLIQWKKNVEENILYHKLDGTGGFFVTFLVLNNQFTLFMNRINH